MILALLPLSASAQEAPGWAWPAGVDFVVHAAIEQGRLTMRPGAGRIDTTSASAVRVDWVCRAEAAGRRRQEMVCRSLTDRSEVVLTWRDGRRLGAVVVDYGEEHLDHLAHVVGGALALWPTEPVAGARWTDTDLGVLRVTEFRSTASGRLDHVVTELDEDVARVRSEGEATFLLGPTGNAQRRLQVAGEGEARLDLRRGLLLERTFQAFPTVLAEGTYGPVGHGLTVTTAPWTWCVPRPRGGVDPGAGTLGVEGGAACPMQP